MTDDQEAAGSEPGRGSSDLTTALADLERARRDRWLVALVLLLAVVAVLSWLVFEPFSLDAVPTIIGAFVVVTVLYGVNVALEERRSRRLIRTLIGEEERRATLTGRISALEALDIATQRVTEAEEVQEVVERILAAARGLLGASGGAVLLWGGHALTVAVSDGPDALPRGRNVGTDHLASAVLEQGSVVRGGPELGVGDRHEVAAPLRLGERIVGVLQLQRGPGERGFTSTEATVLERFGAHAARALRSTSHLDAERRHALEVERITERRLTATADLAADLDPPLAAVTGFLRSLGEHVSVQPADRARVVDEALEALAYVTALAAALMAVLGGTAPGPRPGGRVDLAEFVRAAEIHARGLGLAQGEERRVTVTTVGSAVVEAPWLELQRLVLGMLAATIEASPPGTDLDIELLASGGQPELVITHAGGVVLLDGERLSALRRTAEALGAELLAGRKDGRSQLRGRVPVIAPGG